MQKMLIFNNQSLPKQAIKSIKKSGHVTSAHLYYPNLIQKLQRQKNDGFPRYSEKQDKYTMDPGRQIYLSNN